MLQPKKEVTETKSDVRGSDPSALSKDHTEVTSDYQQQVDEAKSAPNSGKSYSFTMA